MVNPTTRPLYHKKRTLLPIVQEAVWDTGQVWTGAENLASPGFEPRAIQPVVSRYIVFANLVYSIL
jgi:hypothetical protein